jgi:type IV secretory pathway TrbD component
MTAMHLFLTVIEVWTAVSFSLLVLWLVAIEIAHWRAKHRELSPITPSRR